MSDPISSPALIQPGLPLPRLVERGYLWAVAALGGLATGALMIFAVATQSSADAERIAGGSSYAETLVSALAVAQARRTQ
jgi:hypothetical protein